jgi:hypothetical protein
MTPVAAMIATSDEGHACRRWIPLDGSTEMMKSRLRDKLGIGISPHSCSARGRARIQPAPAERESSTAECNFPNDVSVCLGDSVRPGGGTSPKASRSTWRTSV